MSEVRNQSELNEEIKRLHLIGLHAKCVGRDIKQVVELTLRINKLKKEKNAVIPAHVYQIPEIIYGIADFVGDSYRLAYESRKTNADIIIFCGVHFMAETAKILNPEKKVYVPSLNAGCSLADSIKPENVRKLKEKHPGAPVVTYINTSAEVKSESDVIVTSGNAEKILRKMYEKYKKLIFIPDKFMAKNFAKILSKTLNNEMITWDGSCIVHEHFNWKVIETYRKIWPGLVVLAHSECPSDIINAVDFMGGTGDMLKYIEKTDAPGYLLITECGFGELARIKFPKKNFVAMCRLCPYMKSITLEKVLENLENLKPEREITVPPDITEKARKSLEKMFELTQ
jgi:quinolinate synthase